MPSSDVAALVICLIGTAVGWGWGLVGLLQIVRPKLAALHRRWLAAMAVLITVAVSAWAVRSLFGTVSDDASLGFLSGTAIVGLILAVARALTATVHGRQRLVPSLLSEISWVLVCTGPCALLIPFVLCVWPLHPLSAAAAAAGTTIVGYGYSMSAVRP